MVTSARATRERSRAIRRRCEQRRLLGDSPTRPNERSDSVDVLPLAGSADESAADDGHHLPTGPDVVVHKPNRVV
jgi:hypothetical protein